MKDMESEQKDMLHFFLLTYAFSWFFTVPLALRSQGILNIGFTRPSTYIASFGPAFAAIIPFLPLSQTGGTLGAFRIFIALIWAIVAFIWWIEKRS